MKKRSDADLLTIDGIRVTLPYGWANVRASNTQAVLSMRFEGNSPQDLVRIKQEIMNILIKFFDENLLRKELGL